MENKQRKTLNFETFVSQFMGNSDEEFVYEQSPIQIYPLSLAQLFIKPPTPLFRADYSFLLIFQQGGGEQQIDNDTFLLGPNDLLFIREGHLNAINTIKADTEGFFIYLDYTVLPKVFDNDFSLHTMTFNPKHSISKDRMSSLSSCCELMQDQVNSIHSTKIKTALLKALLLMITEGWPSSSDKLDRTLEITLQFKQALFENFNTERKVKFYANKLAVSQNYLNRCITAITAKSPKQHINEIIINQSKIMLQNPANSISQVAYQLNFKDPSHFGRLFKKMTQQTPTAYQNSILHKTSE